MSCVQLSEGVSRWFTPLACGPGHQELSKSYMDMASKLVFRYLHLQPCALGAGAGTCPQVPALVQLDSSSSHVVITPWLQ